MTRKLFFAALALSILLGVAGCRDEGPAEQAAHQMDEAIEETEEKAKKAME